MESDDNELQKNQGPDLVISWHTELEGSVDQCFLNAAQAESYGKTGPQLRNCLYYLDL